MLEVPHKHTNGSEEKEKEKRRGRRAKEKSRRNTSDRIMRVFLAIVCVRSLLDQLV